MPKMTNGTKKWIKIKSVRESVQIVFEQPYSVGPIIFLMLLFQDYKLIIASSQDNTSLFLKKTKGQFLEIASNTINL